MRRTLNIGIGLGTAAIVATMAAGVASATTAGHQQAAGPAAAAVSSVNRHITRAQARQIARAKVPHSRVIEIQSDDRHDRAVWKVELRTRRGPVVVDVDKRTGHAVIVRRGGQDHDGARAERGDRHDHDGRHHHRGDRHDHDRGDDGAGR
jgi:Peptidase propeptide and YPEB domain